MEVEKTEGSGIIQEECNKASEGDPKETLDPKGMKMPALKEALSARNLPTKGLKADLVERLTEALQNESIVEEAKEESLAEEKKPDNKIRIRITISWVTLCVSKIKSLLL